MHPSSTPAPARPRSVQPSQGGLPPKDRFPRGGGDGGGDGRWDNGRRPRQALHRFRNWLAIGIAVDQTLFLMGVILMFARKGATHLDQRTFRQVSDWVPIHLPSILLLSTTLLVLSCITMERARRHIFREIDVLEEWLGLGKPALKASRRWLLASALLSAGFLGTQWLAWQLLAAHGLDGGKAISPAASFVFLLVGLHAAHMLLGLCVLVFCLTALGYLRRVETRQIVIDAAAWYWYTMTLTWLLLYCILRFGQ